MRHSFNDRTKEGPNEHVQVTEDLVWRRLANKDALSCYSDRSAENLGMCQPRSYGAHPLSLSQEPGPS
jgi:hypothetical protein